ncbi:MAG: AzlC family ABC transporter permease [Acidimicrobiia bacterium]
MDFKEIRSGARACVPMLIGVIPFGLVAGVTPVAKGLGFWSAMGMSTIIFAGASQLALVDVLASGGSALIAALAAWTINLRMLLYSASAAPYLAKESLPKRLAVSYLLFDQNYAISVAHWSNRPAKAKAEFALGGGVLLGSAWIICTLVGALLGTAVPEWLPLDFAVPLVFLVLLVPAVVTKPALMAATVGGIGAVVAAEVGASHSSVIIGALLGIAAGTWADWYLETKAGPGMQAGETGTSA